MKKLLIAFQFLTIIPVKSGTAINEADMVKSTSAFVIVGLIQGVLLIATELIFGIFFHPDLTVGIILLALVLTNGGFHLDGLADTFDAIAVKSSNNTEKDRIKRLSVMKDSSIGPIGAVAIIFTLAIKYLALQNLSHCTYFTYYSSLLLMPMLSKWAVVVSMFHGKPAREDGIGRVFLSKIKLEYVVVSTIILVMFFIFLQLAFSGFTSSSRYIFYVVLLTVIYFLCRIWINFFNKKFGGLTGDTLGAVNEGTETIFLLMVIAWSQLFI